MTKTTNQKEAERLHDAMCSWISAKFPRSHTVHVIEEALKAAYDRGVKDATPHACEDCCVINGTVHDITGMSPYPVPPEYLCDDCAEKRYDRHQEKLMEET